MLEGATLAAVVEALKANQLLCAHTAAAACGVLRAVSKATPAAVPALVGAGAVEACQMVLFSYARARAEGDGAASRLAFHSAAMALVAMVAANEGAAAAARRCGVQHALCAARKDSVVAPVLAALLA